MSRQDYKSQLRSPMAITWAVWRALFLREAVARVSVGRAAWVWIVVEPIVHLVFLNLLFGYVLGKMISGVNAGLFITIGIIGYFMFNHTAMRSKEAITANSALLTYRQVLPVDTVMIRAVLEAIVVLLSALVLLVGLGLVGTDVLPHDLPVVMTGMMALWLTGLGVALVLSAAIQLIPEIGKVVNILFYPLYFLSGVTTMAAINKAVLSQLPNILLSSL